MKITMQLLSDAIFGNGASVPGAEDISVLHDADGFPYYKGGTFKGVFREALELYLKWTMDIKDDKEKEKEIARKIEALLGSESDKTSGTDKIIFSDFTLSDGVKNCVLKEIGQKPDMILEAFTNLRVFTAMDHDESGTVKKGSLRMARCVNKGLFYYSEVSCKKDYEDLIKEVLPMIKWIGSMRNRGFGKIALKAE